MVQRDTCGRSRMQRHIRSAAVRACYRATARAVVVFLLATVLPAIGFVVAGPAPEAEARVATGGLGRYVNQIDWFEWGAPGTALTNRTYTNARTVGSSTVVTSCTLSAINGSIAAYRPGSFPRAGLDDLYNIGGTDTRNQLVSGITNVVADQRVNFNVTCAMTLDGATVPVRGLVIADAEHTAYTEWSYVRPTNPTATWRLIDRVRPDGCSETTLGRVDAPNYYGIDAINVACQPVQTGPDTWAVGGPTTVAYLDGSAGANLETRGRTQNALAVGIVTEFDLGDAPASYGGAGAMLASTWSGGAIPGPQSNLFQISMATLVPPTFRLGSLIDSEPTSQSNATATGDSAGVNDDDGFALDRPTDLVMPGDVVTGTAQCLVNTGYVAAWYDWNGNGLFDAGEKSNEVACTGVPVTLSWTVPADAAPAGGSFVRVRLGPNAGLAPTGVTSSGEVEDYAVQRTIATPSIVIDKRADRSSVALGQPITYTFTLQNTGNYPFANTTISDPKLGILNASCGPLAVGATITCAQTGSYTATQADVDAGSTSNTATTAGLDSRGAVIATNQDSVSVTSPRNPGIDLTKSAALVDADGDRLVDVGERITYTFTVRNTGNTTLTNVTLTDPKVGLSAAPCVATLAPGASATCTSTASYTATQSDVDSGSAANTATATATSSIGPITDDGSASVSADTAAAMTMTKTASLSDGDGDARADVGEQITYSFSVTNTGRTTLSNVTVTDAKLGLTNAACVGSLAPGATATCSTTATYAVTQTDVDSGSVANSARASATSSSGATVTADGSATLAVDNAPAMTMTKTAALTDTDGDTRADVGEQITYSFSVTNTGKATLSNVTVTDAKAGLTNAPCVSSLAPGASATCSTTATYSVTQTDVDSGSVANTARASATSPAGSVSTDASAVRPVDNAPAMQMTKTASLNDADGDARADVGEQITYSFSVTNTGKSTLSNVTVTDAKAGLTAAACVTSLAPGATATCSTTATYTVSQSDVDSGTVANSARASASSSSGATVTADASAVVGVDNAPAMTMTKTAALGDADGDARADVGEQVTYSFSVTNTGNATLSNVTVTDAKAGLTAATCVGSLAPGATATCSTTATYTVTQADVDSGSVANSARTSGSSSSGATVTADASATLSVDNAPAMTMTKTALLTDADGDTRADVGERVAYSFSVTNTGKSTLSNVTVTDAKAGLTNAPCVASLAPGAMATCSTTATYTVSQSDVDSGSVANSARTSGRSPSGATVTADASAVLDVDRSSAVELTKTARLTDTDTDGRADVGEIVSYTFTVRNSGTTTLSNVTVTDAKLGLNAAPCATSVAPGASATCTTTATYAVRQADVDSGSVANTASVTATSPTGVVTDDASATLTVDTTSAMTMTKTASLADADTDARADVGEQITYSFAVTNTGRTTLSNVTVTDAKAGLTAAACVTSLAPGATATCSTTATYTVTQADVDSGSVANSARTSGSSSSGATVMADASATLTVDNAPAMTMTKTASLTDTDDDALGDVGEQITYSFSVTNTGKSTLSNVTVTDAKAGLANAPCVASLAPGASATCSTTATYTVTQADVDSGSVANSARTSGSSSSGATVTADGSAVVTVDNRSAMTMTKTASLTDTDDDALADVGEQITYSFAVTNTGNATLSNVTVTDAKAGLTAAECVASLAPGASATCSTSAVYTATQADIDAGTLENAASSAAFDAAGAPVAAEASNVQAVDNSSSMSMTKTASLTDADGDQRADVGELVAYSFAVTNTGNTTLSNVTVTDAKLGLTNAPCVASLAPQATETCTTSANYTVSQSDIDGGAVTNNAAASALDPRNSRVSAAGGAVLDVDTTASMTMTKVGKLVDGDGDGLADVGEAIDYTFTVTNTGRTTLTGATITDPKLGLSDAACAANVAPGATVTCSTEPRYLVTQADVDTGRVPNSATSKATDPSGATLSASASSEVLADDAASIRLDKVATLVESDGNQVGNVGESITYSFTVTNTGRTTLSAVTIDDAKVGLVDAACVDSLAPGASATCASTANYAVTQGDLDVGTIDNIANVRGVDPSGEPVTSSGTSSTPADVRAAMEMTKVAELNDSDGDGLADVGEGVRYSFSVTNVGAVTLSGVTVTDDKLGLFDEPCVDSLAPGASATCTATAEYVVNQADVDSGSVANTARALALDPFENWISADGAAVVQVDLRSSLDLVKTAQLADGDGDGLADLGETVTFTFQVTNSGNVTVSNVTINDPILGVTDARCVDSLAPGQTVTCPNPVTHTVTQADVDAGAIANAATVSALNPSEQPVVGGSSTTTAADQTAAIELVKAAQINDADGDGIADLGESISYTFTVVNVGTVTLSEITVTDAKVGLANAPCVDSLAPGATATCTSSGNYPITQTDVDGGDVINNATTNALDPLGVPVEGDSTTATPTDPTATIELAKTAALSDADGDGLADVGEVVGYSFAVTNTGAVTLSNVTVTDPKLGLSGSPCVDSLAPKATAVCSASFDYTVVQGDIDAGQVSNTATANALDPFSGGVVDEATASVPVDAAPGLALVKTATLDDLDGDSLADVGESISYEFSVTNTGRTTLTGVTITDTKLGLIGDPCIASLAPGASVTCEATATYSVRQVDVDAGSVVNDAVADAVDPRLETVIGAGSAVVQTDVSAGLSLAKTSELDDRDDDQLLDVGETISYQFAVTNEGAVTLSNVTVTDERLGLSAAHCVDSLAPGASATCTATGTHTATQADIDAGGVTNVASVAGTDPSDNIVPAGAENFVAADTTPAVSVVKAATLGDADGDGRADAGESVSYSFSVTNDGKTTLAPVTITDAKLGLTDAPCVETLAPGASVTCETSATYLVSQSDVDAGAVQNNAVVSATAPSTLVVRNDAAATIEADSAASIELTKTANLVDSDGDGQADLGERIDYTFSVTNRGTTTLTSLTINDAKLGLTNAPCLSSLAPGASTTCQASATYVLTQADVDSGAVPNTASVTSRDPQGNAVSDAASAVVQTDTAAGLQLVKSALLGDADGDALADVGERITYSFVVTNSANVTLTNVTITDAKLGLTDAPCVASLAPRSSATCETTASYAATQFDVDAGTVANSAVARASTPGGAATEAAGSTATPTDTAAAITLRKAAQLVDADGDGLADVKETVGYSFEVTNSGNVTLSNVTIDDPKAGLAQAACVSSLAPGETATCVSAVTYPVSQTDVDSGQIANIAVVSAETPQGGITTDDAAATVATDLSAGITMIKTASLDDANGNGLADVGESIRYEFAVTNTGNTTVRALTVTDAKLDLAGVSCLDSVAPGVTASCEVMPSYVVSQSDVDAGSVANAASVTATSATGESLSAGSSTTTPTNQSQGMTLVKSATLADSDRDGLADTGESISYAFEVTNTGTVTILNVTIDDPKLALTDAPCVASVPPGSTVTCQASASYSVTQVDVDSGSVENVATAAALNPSGAPLGADSATSTPTDPTATIELTKTATLDDIDGDRLADVGETVTYRFDVRNTGDVTLTNVTVTDPKVGINAADCVSVLAPGAVATCTVTGSYVVTQADVDAGMVANTATVSAHDPFANAIATDSAAAVATDVATGVTLTKTATLNDSDDDRRADVGETVSYSFDVKNTGKVTLSGVTVTDQKLGLDAAPCVAAIAPGASATCTATASHAVTQAEVDAGRVDNSASVQATDPAGTPISANAVSSTPTDATAAIEVVKAATLTETDGDGLADVGEQIGYSFVVTNTGRTTLSGVTVSDPLVGLDAAACVDSLAPGASATCASNGSYSVRQGDVDAGAVENKAEVQASDPAGVAVIGDGSAVVAADVESGIALTKTATLTDTDGDGLADVGEQIAYSFVVTNTGTTTLSGVTVSDPLVGLQAAACVDSLAPGAQATCASTGTYRVTQADVDAGAVTNSALADATAGAANPISGTASATVRTDATPGVALVKTATLADTDGDGVADVGEQIGYSFVVTNTGTTTLSAVTVNDPLLGLSGAACVDSLAPGAQAICASTGTYPVTQADVDAGAIANTATASATSPNGTSVTGASSTRTMTDQTAVLKLAKTATLTDADGDGRADVGEGITYTFVVTNAGNVTLSNVTLDDPTLALSGAACVGVLAPAASATCTTTGTYVVTQADVDAGAVTNAALATGREPSGNSISGGDSTSTPADQASGLQLVKTAGLADADGDGLADVGEAITYTFDVSNSGNVTLTDVTVDDPKLGLTAAPCVDSLAPGDTAICASAPVYTVAQGDADAGEVANSATAQGQDPSGRNVVGNSATKTPTDPTSSIELVKTAQLDDADGDGLADVGESVSYTLEVTNTGSVTVLDVAIDDPQLGLSGAPCVGALSPGASTICVAAGSYEVTQGDIDRGAVTNTASATGVSAVGPDVTDDASATIAADVASELTLTKSAALADADEDGLADVDETIAYTFEVRNTGTVTLAEVTVTDAMVGLEAAPCVDSLAPGASATCTSTGSYAVTQADVDSGAIANSATVAGSDPSGDPVTAEGSSSTAADRASGLWLVKSARLVDGDGDGLADAGETVSYTFDVSNTGNVTLTNVTVTDAMVGLEAAPCVDSLAPGASATCSSTGSYAVTQTGVDSGAVDNSATVSGSDPFGSAVAASASATVAADVASGLTLAKSARLADGDGDGLADVGEAITYTFDVTNTGNVTLTNVTVTDAMVGLDAAACVDSLAPGASATCASAPVYTVTQPDVDNGAVVNTAIASGNPPSGGAVTAEGSSSTATDQTAALQLVKTATLVGDDGDGFADVGETVAYSFDVTNTGNVTLSNVTVTDAMVGLDAAACVDSLAPGASATCSSTGSYAVTQSDVDSGAVANTATASASDPSGGAVTVEGSASTATDQTATVQLVKTATLSGDDGDGLADVGEAITYTFDVTNTGNVTLTGVTVTDPKLGLEAAACVDSLAPGASATCSSTGSYAVTQADVDSGAIANSATVAGSDPSGDPVTSEGSASTATDQTATVQLVKTATLSGDDGDGLADVGEAITYTFDVTNTGNVTLTGVTVTDPKLGLEAAACVDSLAPGASATCSSTGSYAVTQADVDSGVVLNTATASGNPPSGAAVPAEGSSSTATDRASGLELVKSARLADADGDGLADVGETIMYSFDVSNTGNVTLTNVTVTDPKVGLDAAPCVDSLAPGASATCSSTGSYAVTQAEVDSGAVLNTATTSGNSPSGSAVTAEGASSTATDRTSALQLVKTATLTGDDGDGLADVGESIDYTFDVTNTGTVTITNVTVTDAKLGMDAAPCVDSLAPGASATCSSNGAYQVTQADVDSGAVANTATAVGVAQSGNRVSASAVHDLPTDLTASIDLVKSATLEDRDGDSHADVGEIVRYQFGVTNTGTSTLSNVTIDDAKLGIVGAPCVATLAPGASAECAVTGQYIVGQTDVDAGEVLNSARTAAASPAGWTVDGVATSTTPADTTAEIRMVKSAQLSDADVDALADAGETITYTFEVANTGNVTLSGVTVTDSKVGLIAAPCVDSLAPGATVMCASSGTYTVTQADVDSGAIANGATVSGGSPAGAPVVGGSATTTQADQRSALELRKTARLDESDGDGAASVGDTIAYSFDVSNSGNVTLSAVTVTDSKIGLVAAPCVDSLAPGATVTCVTTGRYTVTQADVDSGEVANSATANGAAPTGASVTGDSLTVTPTNPATAMTMTKSAVLTDADGDGSADVGESVAYTFVVENTGAVTLSQVTIDDPKLGITAGPCVAALAPSASATCQTTATYSVTQADVDAGAIVNRASGSALDPAGRSVNAEGVASTATDQTLSLSMVKLAQLDDRDGDGLADAGETITYRFDVSNTGNVTITDITVSDDLLGLVGAACVDSLAPGATASCRASETRTVTQADVDAGAVANAATVSGEAPSGTPVVGGSSITTPTDQASQLELVKKAQLGGSDTDGVAKVGDVITYTFEVRNSGNVTLSNVTIDDAKLGLVDAACVDSLAPGQSATCPVTATYRVTQAEVDGGEVSNAASATASTPSGAFVSGDSLVVTPTDPTAQITMTKRAQLDDTDGDGIASPGETIAYSFVATNTGAVTVTNVRITDAKIGIQAAPCADSLAPGESAACATTGTYVTTVQDAEAGSVINAATGTARSATRELLTASGVATVVAGLHAVEPQLPDTAETGDGGEAVTVRPTLPAGVDPASVFFPSAGQPDGATVSADGKTMTVPGEGTWSVGANAEVTFAPQAGFRGDPTPVHYSARDAGGHLLAPALISVDYPNVYDVQYEAVAGQPVTVNAVLDPEMVPATVFFPTAGQPEGSGPAPSPQPNGQVATNVAVISADGKTLTVPGEGTWTANSDGTVTFTPQSGFLSSPSPVLYSARDAIGNLALPAFITITVTVPPTLPTPTEPPSTTAPSAPAPSPVPTSPAGVPPTLSPTPTTKPPVRTAPLAKTGSPLDVLGLVGLALLMVGAGFGVIGRLISRRSR